MAVRSPARARTEDSESAGSDSKKSSRGARYSAPPTRVAPSPTSTPLELRRTLQALASFTELNYDNVRRVSQPMQAVGLMRRVEGGWRLGPKGPEVLSKLS